MKIKFNGEMVKISHIVFRETPEDSYISSAHFIETNIELTDEEINDLTDDMQNVIDQEWSENQMDKLWLENQIDKAEAWSDEMKGK